MKRRDAVVAVVNELLATKIRELRRRHALTQEQFARRVKRHPQMSRITLKRILYELRRAENGNGCNVIVLTYIWRVFVPRKMPASHTVERRAAVGQLRSILRAADRETKRRRGPCGRAPEAR